VVKVFLVVALLRNKLWAYPWLIITLVVFIEYQLYRYRPSPALIRNRIDGSPWVSIRAALTVVVG
jgi:uncharacterized membrane protein